MRSRLLSWGIALILPAIVLLCWWWITFTERVPAYLVPSPADVCLALKQYVFDGGGANAYHGRFLSDVGASLSRIGGGVGLATLLGLPLGIVSGRVPVLAQLLSSLVNGLRSVPGICWLPLALIWLGIGTKTAVFLVALAAFFPIYLNAAAGTAIVSPVLIRAGAMLGLSSPAIFIHIIIPAAMPHITTGLRLGLGIGFAYLVLGELTGVPDGIGAMIMDARLIGRVDMIIAGIVLLSALGWLSDTILVQFLRHAFKSGRTI